MNNDSTRNRVRLSQKDADKIKIFSVACLLCIFMGVASIGVQIAALVLSESMNNRVPYGFDVIGFGIWSGIFYLLAGCFGIATTYTRTKSRLMGTVVTSAFSIGASIVSATLSGMAASASGYYQWCSNTHQEELCNPWVVLQWCLMAISVLASIGSIILLILASEVICCSNYNKNSSAMNQQEVNVGGIKNTQQQVYVKPQQPMELNAQQLPTFQVSYVPQLIQRQPAVQLPQPQPQQVSATAPVVHQQLQQQQLASQ